jgi:hypothetical protein
MSRTPQSQPLPLEAKLFLTKIHASALGLAPENLIDHIAPYRYDQNLPRLQTDALAVRLMGDTNRWFDIYVEKNEFVVRTSEKFQCRGPWDSEAALQQVCAALSSFFAAK